MIRARNGPDSWGWVSRALHWGMAGGILAMLPFGLGLGRLEPSLADAWLWGLHKSLGLTLLVLALLRLAWHRLSPPPPTLAAGVVPARLALSAWTHRGLSLLMVAVPVAGWIGASATGIRTLAWGVLPVPAIAPPSEAWDRWGFRAHALLALALALLVALHVAGALWRHLALRDRTLRRMVLGR